MRYKLESMTLDIITCMRRLYLKLLSSMVKQQNTKSNKILRADIIIFEDGKLESVPYVVASMMGLGYYEGCKDIRIITFQYRMKFAPHVSFRKGFNAKEN